jgi:hypothetical protein
MFRNDIINSELKPVLERGETLMALIGYFKTRQLDAEKRLNALGVAALNNPESRIAGLIAYGEKRFIDTFLDELKDLGNSYDQKNTY